MAREKRDFRKDVEEGVQELHKPKERPHRVLWGVADPWPGWTRYTNKKFEALVQRVVD